MDTAFEYDVFLSHNSKDKVRVRQLANRLREAGLRVWFDEWVILPGDDIFLSIENGLDKSKVLILCISQNALNSDWVTLERNTSLFRDPTNADRRFIPILLDDCKMPSTLRRYKYVDFREETDESFSKLIVTCQMSIEFMAAENLDESSEQIELDKFAKLKKSPEQKIEVIQKTKVPVLDLSEMGLAHLPEALGKHTHMELLDLSTNKLTQLPDWFAQLRLLISLNLADNKFRPHSFCRKT